MTRFTKNLVRPLLYIRKTKLFKGEEINKILKLASLAFAAGLITSCSHNEKTADASTSLNNTDRATFIAGGSQYVVIEFAKGSARLSQDSKTALTRLTDVAEADGRKLDEVKVLAWADREYPDSSAKATRQDIKLADERASQIKNYIKNQSTVMIDVDKHNMAKRPGVFSEIVKTDDYKLKTVFEDTGAAPVSLNPDAKLAGGKVSNAVILVKYK